MQSLVDAHRYAHAQVVGAGRAGENLLLRGSAEDTVETRLSDQHGPANLSRILCPKRLDDGVSYIAALVPAFDCGVKAGLGLSGGTLAPAWTRAGGDEQDDIVLPAYDSWRFRTAAGGDFLALAQKIKGIAAPWSVGRRAIDLSLPGGDIPALPVGQDGGVQVMECALFSPALNGPAAPAHWPVAHREAVRVRVDEANANTPNLPRVGARLYARYQRAATRIGPVFGIAPFAPGAGAAADADWFSQINTHPLHRIVAGLGARVVQRDQEPLMQAAWAQVEGIRRANQIIAWAALAEVVNVSIMARHVEPLDAGRLLQVTRNMHTRIRDAGQPRTVATAITLSRTADSTLGAAFRRAVRPDGPLSKRAQLAAATAGQMVAAEGKFRDHRMTYKNPDGIDGLSDEGRAFFTADVIAKVMKVPVDRAVAAFQEKLVTLVAKGPALGALAIENWAAPVNRRPGDAIGGQLLDSMTKDLPAGVAGQPVAGAEVLAQIAVGLTHGGGNLGGAAAQGLELIERVTPRANLVAAVPRIAPTIQPSPSFNVPLQPMLRGRAPAIVDRRAEIPAIVRDAAGAAAPILRFETALSRHVTKTILDLNQLDRSAFIKNVRDIVIAAAEPPKVSMDLGALTVTKPGVLAQIEPRMTARAAFKGRITKRPGFLASDWFERVGMKPILAAPVFHRPMYAALEDYDRDWLVPGLGTIPDHNFITLLSINPGFAEAFLIGASDEMGRELLWRDYPTDQRGTYFKRFWDADEDELTVPIHQFKQHPAEPLGRHFSIGGDKPAGAGALALVVRGELLRRFPDTVIAAMQATGSSGRPTFIANSEAPILFHAHLDPDYVLVGFDLTVEQVTGGGNWWFVFAQNPVAPRFGLATNPSVSTDHNSLDWADFGPIPPGGFLSASRNFAVTDPNSHPATVQWPGHAGVVARVLLTNPIRAAFRADKLIASIRTPS